MKYNWSKENLESCVKEANCWFNWLDKLNIPKAGGNYRTLKNKAKEYSIDVSHFNYDYAHTHNGKKSAKNLKDEELFSKTIGHHKDVIKREYILRCLNGQAKCEICGIHDWNKQPIVFQIHHIDGNNRNNEKDNLQLLCPNCHSQTDNFSNKKRNNK